jgi:hypothetical protein
MDSSRSSRLDYGFMVISNFMVLISLRPCSSCWTTTWFILILEVMLGLKSKQGDIMAAYVHADVEGGKNIYVEMSCGFRKQGYSS